MRALATRQAIMKILLWIALLFPMFWIVLGGILRTPLLFAAGSLAIYLLRKRGLHSRLRDYGSWMALGLLLAGMAVIKGGSESQLISPPWFALVVLYSVPVGMLIAHDFDESETTLNSIFAWMLLLFSLWGLLVMQQVDMAEIVRTQEHGDAVRVDQRYPVELFYIFSWDNVKMQLIPWCAYPLATLIAIACRNTLVVRGLLLSAAVLAAYVGGAFLTRTVFLAGGLGIGVVILLFMAKADMKRRVVMATMVLLLGIAIVEVVQSVPVVNEYVVGLFDRFSNTADDSRQYLWASSAHLILQNPFGGGDALLEEHLWAHDLPLDMGLLYGIPGFITMTCLLLMLVVAVGRWAFHLRSEIKSIEIILLTMFIAALTSGLISPPDLAFITPLLLVAAFAKERVWVLAARARAVRRVSEQSQRAPELALHMEST